MASRRGVRVRLRRRKENGYDVHATLAAILEKEGGLSQEEAADYLHRMQQEKRYQRDVY